MNAVLPKRLERFVRRQVKAGRYQNQSHVVRDALSRLEKELEHPANSMPSKLPPSTLETIYAAESAAERKWENRTAEASSLTAEVF